MQERADLSETKNHVKYQNLEEENRALRAKIKRIEQERNIFKKSRSVFCKPRSVRYTLRNNYRNQILLENCLKIF